MHIILLPLLVACFGWLISWGFIKIIFFPHQSIRFAGRQWQSLFSKKAGQISISQLLPELTQGDSFQKLLPFIDAKLDEFFKERLVQKMPVISNSKSFKRDSLALASSVKVLKTIIFTD